MNFKRPTSPVFWVPIPDTGQSRMELLAWQYLPGKEPAQMPLTDPDTGEYIVEILDYHGAYKITEIPNFYARQIINSRATGAELGKLLLQRVPEFRKCEKVLIYQVNPLTNG
ncbi:MAG: hypothetical protein Q8J97_02245 [Flavobacteriaceae bacterium]|nr:hypothetical protein [Flavobacteriaceae bacterium]